MSFLPRPLPVSQSLDTSASEKGRQINLIHSRCGRGLADFTIKRKDTLKKIEATLKDVNDAVVDLTRATAQSVSSDDCELVSVIILTITPDSALVAATRVCDLRQLHER